MEDGLFDIGFIFFFPLKVMEAVYTWTFSFNHMVVYDWTHEKKKDPGKCDHAESASNAIN